MNLENQIKSLKKEKNATILAHFYQTTEVQQCADFIGDSLELARIAQKEVISPFIIFAGVRFMAETAKILNPTKKVLLPAMDAGCPLSEFLPPKIIHQYRKQFPQSPVVLYVNTSAESKALTDVCCTSSNAVKIVQKAAEFWHSSEILFGPDKNLAYYVQSNIPLLHIIPMPANGHCPIHQQKMSIDDVYRVRETYPKALLLVHPECTSDLQKAADFIGSTSGFVRFVKERSESISSQPQQFIIGTEIGLIGYLTAKFPQHEYIPLSTEAQCKNMKKITLNNIYSSLQAIGTPLETGYTINIDPDIAQAAKKSVDRMLEWS